VTKVDNGLYPGNGDPQLVGRAISHIVHRGYSAEQAPDFMRTAQAEQGEVLARLH
jgi:hypothetical protein